MPESDGLTWLSGVHPPLISPIQVGGRLPRAWSQHLNLSSPCRLLTLLPQPGSPAPTWRVLSRPGPRHSEAPVCREPVLRAPASWPPALQDTCREFQRQHGYDLSGGAPASPAEIPFQEMRLLPTLSTE